MKNIVVPEDQAVVWSSIKKPRYRVELNSDLIQEMMVPPKKVVSLFKMHGKKCGLFNDAHLLLQRIALKGEVTSEDIQKRVQLNSRLRKLEFKAQKAWGFPKDITYHNWWLEMPGCSCPRMDNIDRAGIKGVIITDDCLWHGQKYIQKKA